MRKITKQVYENGIFVEKKFVIRSHSETDFLWLHEQYGTPKYLITWWKTHTEVGMTEKVFVHYTLCH